jgi:hypothetical protein
MEVHYAYTEGDWLVWAFAMGAVGLLALGAVALLWFHFRRK